jgi:trans-feruloyl-CoA hydratase/vanillin synthase
MNRPDKRNAMSPQLHLDMDDALDELAGDPETQVLVLTGAGEAFCAGQDIKLYFRGGDAVGGAPRRRASNQWRWQKLSTFPKPTIAMVNGYCFGGGFTQVCACDFAIAADDTVFGLSEVNWGILPGGIVSWNVTQALNYRDSLYYALTGDSFYGKKAKEIGFVNFSVPRAMLRATTIALAKKMMAKNPAAVRYTKEAIRAVRFMNEPRARLPDRQRRRAAVQRQERAARKASGSFSTRRPTSRAWVNSSARKRNEPADHLDRGDGSRHRDRHVEQARARQRSQSDHARRTGRAVRGMGLRRKGARRRAARRRPAFLRRCRCRGAAG